MRISLRTLPLLLALVGMCAPPALATDATVYSIGLNPPVSEAVPTVESPCMTRVRFIGTVSFGNDAPAGDLTYHIRYSDGSTGSDTVVKHQAAGLTSQTMDIRTFYQATDGSASLVITNPIHMETIDQPFHVTCPGLATIVSISKPTMTISKAPMPDLPCQQAAKFENTISAPDLDPKLPAPVVTYRFVRSDNYASKIYTHTFGETRTKVVHDTWTLFTAAHGWERVEILTPAHIFSDKASFTTTCGPKEQSGASQSGNGHVQMSGSTVTQTNGSEKCQYVLDFHTTVNASDWPGSDRTFRWRAVRSTNKIYAHVIPNFAGPMVVHSEWRVHAPFSGWLQFQITAPNSLKGKMVNVSIPHCYATPS